jgi:TetR/AcrR family transcriptional regulator, transcriptional repressor for nem operon
MNKAEKTRQYIIEKAAPIFNMKGYAGTSLSDMTAATGLTKGSIYGNFSNKDEVALAAFEHNVQCVTGVVRERMEAKNTVREKLLVYVETYGQFPSLPFPKGGCAILNTAVEADDTHPVLKEKAREKLLIWKNRLANLIQSGIDSGELSQDTDPEKAALTCIALLEGGVMIGKATGQRDYLHAVLGSLKNFINEL